MSDSTAQRHVTADPHAVREWAEEHDAVAIYDADAGGDRREYRLVAGDQVPAGYEREEWETFVDHFEASDQALLYREDGGLSDATILGRDEAVGRATLEDEEIERRLLEGETVRTEITETAVVERTVVETETVETEVVDTEVVGARIVGATLREWEVVDQGHDVVVEAVDVPGREVEHAPDERLDYETVDLETTASGTTELEIEERWQVEREVDERVVVESKLTDVDVTEHDEVADESLEVTVDTESVHRQILESDAVAIDEDALEASEAGTITTERPREDLARSHLVQRRRYEDDVRIRRLLNFDFESAEVLSAAATDERLVDTTVADVASEEPAADAETGVSESTSATDQATATAGAGATATGVDLSDDDVGKDVVDQAGHDVGVVASVEGDAIRVDPGAGLLEQIEIALGWHDAEADEYRVGTDQIARVEDDAVVLRATEVEER